MLELIIAHINNQLITLNSFQKFLGLCEKITDTKGETKSFPAEYCTKDNYKPIDIDYQKGLVYHRLIGAITNEDSEEDAVSACDVLQTITYPMRLIASVPKTILDLVNDNQFIEDKIAQNIQNALTTVNSSTLATSLKADSVMISVTTRNLDRYSVWADEYTNIPMAANFDVIYISVDYEIEITGTNTCFENEGCDPSVLLCDISKVTNANLTDPDIGLTTEQLCFPVLPLYDFSDPDTIDCLTDQQLADLSSGLYFPVYVHNNAGGFDMTNDLPSGTYDIDWGDGSFNLEQATGLVSHLYTGAVTRTIKMRRNLDTFTSMDAPAQDILTASFLPFTACLSFTFENNSNLTSVVMPISTAITTDVRFMDCDLATLDLSPMSNLAGDLDFEGNSNMTSIAFPNTSQVIDNLQLQSCDFQGTLVLSGLTALEGNLTFQTNADLTGVLFPVTTGVFTLIRGQDCNFNTLDFTPISNLAGSIDFAGNSNLSSVSFPASAGVITNMQLEQCNFGTINFSPLTGLSGILRFNANSILTAVTLPATAGVFSLIVGNSCDLTVVDFSVLLGNNSNVDIRLQNNNMAVGEVNETLCILDATTWINGIVNLSGTNAAPDGATFCDGVTAKANLIVDGWTVTTN